MWMKLCARFFFSLHIHILRVNVKYWLLKLKKCEKKNIEPKTRTKTIYIIVSFSHCFHHLFLKCSVNNILNSFGGCMCISMVCWASFDCVWEKIFSVDICIIFYSGKISSWMCFWRLKIKLFTLLQNKQKKNRKKRNNNTFNHKDIFIYQLIKLLPFLSHFLFPSLKWEEKKNPVHLSWSFLHFFSVYDYVYNFIWRIFHFVVQYSVYHIAKAI